MKAILFASSVCILAIAAAIAVTRLPGSPSLATDVSPPIQKIENSRPMYTLNTQNPDQFLQEHLQKVFTKPEYGLIPTDSIDEHATIQIQKLLRAVDMNVMLISASQMKTDYYYILFVGEAQSADDAYSLARKICSVVGIPSNKIDAWLNDGTYRQLSFNDCLQVGETADGFKHSITIRNSLSIDKATPWGVDYTIYFHVPEQKVK